MGIQFMEFEIEQAWTPVLSLPLTISMNVGKWLNLSELQIPHP